MRKLKHFGWFRDDSKKIEAAQLKKSFWPRLKKEKISHEKLAKELFENEISLEIAWENPENIGPSRRQHYSDSGINILMKMRTSSFIFSVEARSLYEARDFRIHFSQALPDHSLKDSFRESKILLRLLDQRRFEELNFRICLTEGMEEDDGKVKIIRKILCELKRDNISLFVVESDLMSQRFLNLIEGVNFAGIYLRRRSSIKFTKQSYQSFGSQLDNLNAFNFWCFGQIRSDSIYFFHFLRTGFDNLVELSLFCDDSQIWMSINLCELLKRRTKTKLKVLDCTQFSNNSIRILCVLLLQFSKEISVTKTLKNILRKRDWGEGGVSNAVGTLCSISAFANLSSEETFAKGFKGKFSNPNALI
eukprot:snap_masked-scaffold_10-processed-gene-13.43-mRNA-1 protein AED:1.00 eAED:1.00 QI:0/-1/0/0/-1/1/1/0/361